MMYLILKIFISALTLVGVSEIAKRTPGVGGLIASLPLVSILALSWLYLETRDTGKVIALSESIFWMVLPSLAFFWVLPIGLKQGWPYWGALLFACGLTGLIYYLAYWAYEKLGIQV
ncbi:MAG: DUF3147 family protein [Cyanobacteria bacterium]|nr:DUF3147 family protein [Cyanobacteriota bacterium]